MNGNQGLEALAALCGGEAAVATDNINANTSYGTSTATENGGKSSLQLAQPQLQTQNSQSNPLADGLARQQWQHAVAAAAALGAGTVPAPANAEAATGLTAQGLAILSATGLQQGVQQQLHQQQHQAQQQPTKTNADSNVAALAAMQQLAYFRFIQEQTTAAVAKIGQSLAPSVNTLLHSNPKAMALVLASQAQQLQHHLNGATDVACRQQVLPSAGVPTPSACGEAPSFSTSSMPPPPSVQGGTPVPSALSTAGIVVSSPSAPKNIPMVAAARKHTAIAPLPNTTGAGHLPVGMCDGSGGPGVVLEDKKYQKRAANRRSAQLSRKRKKQFIEELKDENDELRRKEQILRSIPDLIVVFDSTGKLWFVSQSVFRFTNMTAQELEGTSFWDRLCEDSVRLLKAAFMDSLAARTDDSDTAPLGSGIWELRLIDKDGSHKVVSLNGVVHFSGDRPECVCSIRPRDKATLAPPKLASGDAVMNEDVGEGKVGFTESSCNETTTTSSTFDTSDRSSHFQPLMRAKPQQSVICNSSSTTSGDSSRIKQSVKNVGSGKSREAARISDGDSASTDSGSSDEMGE